VDRDEVAGEDEDERSIKIGGYPLTGIIRQVRRRADFSQRELAKWAKISPSAVGAIESGALMRSIPTLQRLLNAANCQLVVVDGDGRLVVPLMVWGDVRDGAGRRLPAHLDTILDPEPGEWWADGYGLTRPPETFRRNRVARDWQRKRSREDVREHGSLRADRLPRLPPGMKPGEDWRRDR
jgi:transcriptional regulator with XRE-family HTH domain